MFFHSNFIRLTQGQRLQHDYELQVSNMTKSIANLEESNRDAENERYSLMQDLAAVRDLCSKLEMDKETLQRQLTAKVLDLEKVCKITSRKQSVSELSPYFT